jgi:hypothetical protein
VVVVLAAMADSEAAVALVQHDLVEAVAEGVPSTDVEEWQSTCHQPNCHCRRQLLCWAQVVAMAEQRQVRQQEQAVAELDGSRSGMGHTLRHPRPVELQEVMAAELSANR